MGGTAIAPKGSFLITGLEYHKASVCLPSQPQTPGGRVREEGDLGSGAP